MSSSHLPCLLSCLQFSFLLSAPFIFLCCFFSLLFPSFLLCMLLLLGPLSALHPRRPQKPPRRCLLPSPFSLFSPSLSSTFPLCSFFAPLLLLSSLVCLWFQLLR